MDKKVRKKRLILRLIAVVIAAGVYLRSRTFTGPRAVEGGPAGLMAATELTGDLLEKGIAIRRFKTGTPARVNANTVDFSTRWPRHSHS